MNATGFALVVLALTSCSSPESGGVGDRAASIAMSAAIPLRERLPALDVAEPVPESADASRFRADAFAPVVDFSPSVVELCAAIVAKAKSSSQERLKGMNLSDFKARAPWCRPEATSHALSALFTHGVYRSLRSVRLDDGIATESHLVVETNRGFALTGIGWNREDPQDPGCRIIVREQHVESAYVENGHLVVMLGATRAAYVDVMAHDADVDPDDGYRPGLVKLAAWCKDDGAVIECHQLRGLFGEFLGRKVFPGRDWSRGIRWDAFPWTDELSFSVDDTGAFHVRSQTDLNRIVP